MVLDVKRFAAFSRRAVAALLASSLVLLAGAPLCASDACPMSKSERVACRMMGLDCCQAKGGTVSHSSFQPSSLLQAVGPASTALAAGGRETSSAAASPVPWAAPAVLQGVGLLTLIAVCRI